MTASFHSMEVRNSMFAAYIDGFTTNTYVMVIMSDPSICEFYFLLLSALDTACFVITYLLFTSTHK